MKNSLVRQLIIRLLVATGIALAATGVLLVWQFQHASAVVVDRGLSRTLDDVVRHLHLDPTGRPVAELPAELAARFNDELFFTVTDEHGRAFFSVPTGREHSYHPFEPSSGDEPQYFEHNYLQGGENYLGVTQKVVLEKQEFWLQLVEEVPEWQNFLHFSIEVFLHGAGILIVLHFLGSAFLAYTTLSNSFRPVEDAALAASRIVPGRGDIRIGIAGLPAEVAPFARAINAALDRLDSALAAQKRFTADAAHELLTPLAVMKADIEEMENREAAAALADDVEEMTGIVTQLLELSEFESDPKMANDIVDLRQIASDVLTRMAPLAIRDGLTPELTGAEEPVRVTGCPKALTMAVTNLVKNVLQHAAGATKLEIAVQHGGRLSVIDDGPGVRPELRERIFERFYRADGARKGHRGLGLAIVRRIVEAHRGRAYVTDGPGGRGAAFVIELPPA